MSTHSVSSSTVTAANAFSTPRMSDLVREVEAISPNAPVLELLALFHEKEAVLAVPLLDEQQRYLGIVSRRAFMSVMSRAYAREIYVRKPVTEIVRVMPELAAAPVTPAPEDRVDRVLAEYLDRDPGMFYDALPVISGERLLGIVSIADMMLSLSESQGKLLGAVQALSDRLKQEVALAAQLQRQLLPPSDIALPGVKGLATLLTSSEVGGDYYHCYTVDGRYAVLMIGDVSGHGVAAGTLVSAANAGVNLLATAGERHPGRILARLNGTLLSAGQQTLYMTFFVACLDTLSGELAYANAGHQFPYLYRAMTGTLEMLEIGGLPLGKSAQGDYAVAVTEMDLGDRLFFYTDGLLEERDAADEPFGYERLEALLNANGGEALEGLRDRILEALARYAGSAFFEDDVTLFAVEYYEKPLLIAETEEALPNVLAQSLVRLPESWYRANEERFSPYLSRQTLIFLAEAGFSDLLPRFARDGIRRVLPRHQPFVQRLGWDALINQHQLRAASDLAGFIPGFGTAWRDFHLVHSEDKAFVIGESGAFLEEAGVGAEYVEAALLAIDELLENGLYAAPKNGKGAHLYAKGERRALAGDESLSLYVALKDRMLGLSVIDNWGTLTPAIFLHRFARHAEGEGLISGRGGAGFYLLWRLSDYLQVRVLPHRQTQITVLFDLTRFLDADTDKGFQFLFHSEVHEVTHHVSIDSAYSAGKLG
jgi:serine phosphatase RsbU (regulator of sigma subunit)